MKTASLYSKIMTPNTVLNIQNTLLQQHNIIVLPLQSYSPDLNPVENIWAVITNAINRKKKIQNTNDMKREVMQIWDSCNAILYDPKYKCIPGHLNTYVAKNCRLTKYYFLSKL